MIREIENVFVDLPGYQCFGCDPMNDCGLKIKIFANDETGEVFTRIKTDDHFSGFPGILHGGIQCTLIDEIAFWVMFDRVKKIGVTANIQIDFFKTINSSLLLEVRGIVDNIRENTGLVDVNISNENNEVYTRAKIIYYIADNEKMLKILGKERIPAKLLRYLDDKQVIRLYDHTVSGNCYKTTPLEIRKS
ncbi:MAG TPA: PaaI family thioesterase [Thermodesulfobacteriota bacterium]